MPATGKKWLAGLSLGVKVRLVQVSPVKIGIAQVGTLEIGFIENCLKVLKGLME